jgi:glycosyltransferase involved in cell wall biosynthesis
MNILLMTNTYLPHVGGVARSVATFEQEYRRRGHNVLVVAPEFEGQAEVEPNVVRVPAIQHFNGSDFSFPVPVPGLLQTALREFKPDIVHSHHPFLLGAAAVRIAKSRQIPLVFTNHTLYEHYTHYVGSETNMLARFITTLTVGYSNLCDAVIAPSRSVADMLHSRGVQSHVFIVPTGIETERFAAGDGNALRREFSLPEDAFIVGHVGRLTPEKNLPFLARAVVQFVKRTPHARFLVVGAGPSEDDIRGIFREAGLLDRLHMVGVCQGQRLIDAYHAMDVFGFASQTETQGLVLVEAMAAGRPVVALDGPGVREVVESGINGELLAEQDEDAFAATLGRLAAEQAKHPRAIRAAAQHTADTLSLERMAERALRIYGALVKHHCQRRPAKRSPWRAARKYIKAEIDYLIVGAKATGSMLGISE